MAREFSTEAKAMAYVNKLRVERGVWTGYRRHSDGTCTVEYEPHWTDLKADAIEVKLPSNDDWWAYLDDSDRFDWLPPDDEVTDYAE